MVFKFKMANQSESALRQKYKERKELKEEEEEEKNCDSTDIKCDP